VPAELGRIVLLALPVRVVDDAGGAPRLRSCRGLKSGRLEGVTSTVPMRSSRQQPDSRVRDRLDLHESPLGKSRDLDRRASRRPIPSVPRVHLVHGRKIIEVL